MKKFITPLAVFGIALSWYMILYFVFQHVSKSAVGGTLVMLGMIAFVLTYLIISAQTAPKFKIEQ